MNRYDYAIRDRLELANSAEAMTMGDILCAIDGCELKVQARNLCNGHYKRWQIGASMERPISRKGPRTSMEVRFWGKVQKRKGNGCWLWKGFLDSRGYGRFTFLGSEGKYKTSLAHRWAYENVVELIPVGLELDHLCRTPSCVRPDHLDAVTHLVNVQRGNAGKKGRQKTRCKNGHPFTPENTYIRPNSNQRDCRICTLYRTWKKRGKLLEIANPEPEVTEG